MVIGLGTSIKDRIGQASGFDKFILFGPLLFAIAMAVFGADHLVTASFVAKIVSVVDSRTAILGLLCGVRAPLLLL